MSFCFKKEDGSGHIVKEDKSGCIQTEAGILAAIFNYVVSFRRKRRR